jgi:protoheme IX farnesyltransferase
MRAVGRVSIAAVAGGYLLLVAGSIALGPVVVPLEVPAVVLPVYLGLAQLALGAVVWLTVWRRPEPQVLAKTPSAAPSPAVPKGVVRLVLVTMLLTLVLILSGAYVRAAGASWSCVGFPTCNGEPLPFGSDAGTDLNLVHRLLAYATAWLIGLSLYQVSRRCSGVPALQRAGSIVTGLVLGQIAVGAYGATFGIPPLVQALHLTGASAVWAGMVTLAALAVRAHGLAPNCAASDEAAGRSGSVIGAYIQLTKPRVMVLLLITTLASMLVAAGGMPGFEIVFFTLLGGALASGGAGAINHYLDRDIDGLMGRTATRPVVSGAVPASRALAFGIALGVLSFVLMTAFVNLLAAVLSLAGLLFYVFVYTRWLKRSTPNNIVIGGAAGAIPPVVGWAAVTGEIGLLAVCLFTIVFVWTPPHFWALALLMQQEYARAKVPMLPNVKGEAETRRQILLYSLVLVATTLGVFGLKLLGLVYLVSALVLGGLFLYYAVRLWREASQPAARRLFRYSIIYLTLLFAAMVVDRQVVL